MEEELEISDAPWTKLSAVSIEDMGMSDAGVLLPGRHVPYGVIDHPSSKIGFGTVDIQIEACSCTKGTTPILTEPLKRLLSDSLS